MAAKSSYILLTPGPVPLSRKIRQVLSQPAGYHRSARFQKILRGARPRLQSFFQTEEPVIVLSSAGTGAMEAAVANTLSPGDPVICVCSGKFGERWRDICLSYRLAVDSLNIPFGEAVAPEQAADFLKSRKGARAFLISACETSTGARHPIREISLILKGCPDTLFMVDGSTGLGAMDLPMDEWGIDVLLGGSQKGFMIPAGLSLIALFKKSLEPPKSLLLPQVLF